MLCDACIAHLAPRRELVEYLDPKLSVEYRRNAAIILVTLARRRKRAESRTPAAFAHHVQI